MAVLYVRIPRNRWTPIGEIDVDGYGSFSYPGQVEVCRSPLITIDSEYLAAMREARRLLKWQVKQMKKSPDGLLSRRVSQRLATRREKVSLPRLVEARSARARESKRQKGVTALRRSSSLT